MYECTACRRTITTPTLRTVAYQQHGVWHFASHLDCPLCSGEDTVGILTTGEPPMTRRLSEKEDGAIDE